MSPPKRPLRCAVYTRKSTEEGLDQAFNSLHAQREACEAYIKSQVGEGWQLVRTAYDDGGFSGGTMDRPALQQLLSDIDGGRLDTVVVYKVDRLTRSLADFAKIVERFEKRGVSFVSVTQSFNTTTSMGRLTLNVLLSFAQFEREVASERIRDKVAASRKKGMWMGGTIPTGYDLLNRKLVPNDAEAKTIRMIFRRYVDLRSVDRLLRELRSKGVTSKVRVTEAGKTVGGNPFSRGALNHVIQNRIYVGDVAYKGNIYAGEHLGIVDRDLFDQAQAILDHNRRLKFDRPKTRQAFPLTGLIFDDRGNVMSPLHGQKKGGRRYRYYVSRALIKQERDQAGSIPRVPAQAIEDIVSGSIARLLTCLNDQMGSFDRGQLVAPIRRLEIGSQSIRVAIDPRKLVVDGENGFDLPNEEVLERLRQRAGAGTAVTVDREDLVLEVKIRAKFHGGEHHLIPVDGQLGKVLTPRPDRALVKAVVRSHAWLKLILDGSVNSIEGLARKTEQDFGYARRVLRLAFLSPDITSSILEGRQPAHVSLTDMFESEISNLWSDQAKLTEL